MDTEKRVCASSRACSCMGQMHEEIIDYYILLLLLHEPKHALEQKST